MSTVYKSELCFYIIALSWNRVCNKIVSQIQTIFFGGGITCCCLITSSYGCHEKHMFNKLLYIYRHTKACRVIKLIALKIKIKNISFLPTSKVFSFWKRGKRLLKEHHFCKILDFCAQSLKTLVLLKCGYLKKSLVMNVPCELNISS